jgi:hypothetical protein
MHFKMRRRPLWMCLAIAFAVPAHAQSPGPADTGARIGQARSAAKICPGAKLTPKVEELSASMPAETQAEASAAAAKVEATWAKTFDCFDYDPETRRATGCRKLKIMSCNAAWTEIGPEGTAIPGLLEFSAPPEDTP